MGVTLLGYTDLHPVAILEGELFPESRSHVKLELLIHHLAECCKWIGRESLVVETGWGSGDFIILGRVSGFETLGLMQSGAQRAV